MPDQTLPFLVAMVLVFQLPPSLAAPNERSLLGIWHVTVTSYSDTVYEGELWVHTRIDDSNFVSELYLKRRDGDNWGREVMQIRATGNRVVMTGKTTASGGGRWADDRFELRRQAGDLVGTDVDAAGNGGKVTITRAD